MRLDNSSSPRLYELALSLLENVHSDIALSFKRDFPELGQLPSVHLKPIVLPIASSVLEIGEPAPSTTGIVQAVQQSYRDQQWRQPYQEDELGSEFFHGTAWFPIADVEGPILYSRGLMEIMLMGPKVTYPNHKHSPEELYLILAGQVWWETEGKQARWKYAGDVMHHRPHAVHSITAGDEAVLILSLWRGGGFEMPVFADI